MRVLLLGATGPSGILIIHEFFKAYPDGTLIIYARNPSKLRSQIISNPSITIIKGELTDTDSLIVRTCRVEHTSDTDRRVNRLKLPVG